MTPWTAAHQAPPSMRLFSRFKTLNSVFKEMKVPQLCPTLCDPMVYIYSPWNSVVQNTEVGRLSLLPVMYWRRKWQPTLVFLPGESRDGGAWWAAVYGVAQSRTRLKWIKPRSPSSQSRDRTQVFCISDRFFTSEPPGKPIHYHLLTVNLHQDYLF